MEPAGRPLDGRSGPRDPRSGQAQARGEIRDGALRVRVHDLGAAQRAGRRGQASLLRAERRGPDPRAWLAAAPVRAFEILLEVGQVAARARVHGTQPARFLGATRLSRRSRPLERNEVLVAVWTGPRS